MKPMLMRSGLTDRLYIVTRYKDRGEGRYEAVTKYEVTDAELDACGLARSTAETLDVERHPCRGAIMTSIAERTLAAQLEQAGIPFDREFRFTERRWRFDFVVGYRTAVEIEGGSFTGGHKRGKAYETDCEKHNAAMFRGWRVYRFTPAMVNDGRALEWVKQALGLVA